MDSLMREAGLCGRYQVIHVIFTQLPRFMAMWSLFFMMFGGFDPGWRCVTIDSDNDSDYSNSSLPTTPTVTSIDNSNNSLSSDFLSSAYNNINNESKSVTSKYGVYSNTTHSFLGDDSYNGTCNMIHTCNNRVEFDPTSSTIVTEFGTICDRAWILTAILFVQGVGCLVGPLAGGQIGERFGRKIALYSSTVILCLANFFAIFSTHWVMFATCYFFVGASGNAIIGISAVYTMEFLNAKGRGYFISIPVSNVALCLFVFITAAVKDWVSAHLIATSVCFLACAGFFLLTESPRWLFVNGKMENMRRSVTRIARINKKTPVNDLCFKNLHEPLNEENGPPRSYTFLDLFKDGDTRMCTFKFIVIHIAMDITYLSVTFGIKSLPGDYYMNAIEALCTEMAMVLLVGPLCNIIGRRFSGLLFACIGCVSSLSIVLILVLTETMHSEATALKIFTFAAKGSSQCMCLIAAVFSVEQFPTAVRNVAAGILRVACAVSGMLGPFLVPEKNENSMVTSFSIMCGLYFINTVLFPSFPETKGTNLKDGISKKINTIEIAQDED